jgi:hypothetical protein
MSATFPLDHITPAPESDRVGVVLHRIGAVDVLLLSAWCGLAAGLLETGVRVVCGTIAPIQRLYMVSRHFLWLGPLSNLLLFLGMGLVLSVASKLSPRAVGWLGPRLICACATLPVLMAAFPQIHAEAWAIFGLGIAVQLVPILERRITALRWRLLVSFVVMLGLVILLASYANSRQLPVVGRIPGEPWLCDCGICRQSWILFSRNWVGPRLYSLRRLRHGKPGSASDIRTGGICGRRNFWNPSNC